MNREHCGEVPPRRTLDSVPVDEMRAARVFCDTMHAATLHTRSYYYAPRIPGRGVRAVRA
jgi:hypothetical protein